MTEKDYQSVRSNQVLEPSPIMSVVVIGVVNDVGTDSDDHQSSQWDNLDP